MEWLPIPGYQKYQMAADGTVRRFDIYDNIHIVKSTPAANGQRLITLWKDGKRKCFMLHNVYMSVFHTSKEDTLRILYKGFNGKTTAKQNVCNWISLKMQELEQQQSHGDYSEEIRYLQECLTHLTK